MGSATLLEELAKANTCESTVATNDLALLPSNPFEPGVPGVPGVPSVPSVPSTPSFDFASDIVFTN